MKTIDVREAKAHFSSLVESAAKGMGFIIAKDGKPMVKVVPLDPPAAGRQRRLGFLEGWIKVPDDYDDIGRMEIERTFEGDS